MNFNTKNSKKAAIFAASTLGLAGLALNGSAETLFATSYDPSGTFNGGIPAIYRVDTVAQTVTKVFDTGPLPHAAGVSGPDSLIFTDPNNILYTSYDAGQIRNYNLITNTDTLVSTSGGIGVRGPRDLVLEPGGNTVLFSDNNLNQISRLNLTTHVVTPFRTGVLPEGLIYDKTGQLFAGLNPNVVARLDPATGATLSSITLAAGVNIDGLTYDDVNNFLYVSNSAANGNAGDPATGPGLFRIPTTLASSTPLALGQFRAPDGIVYKNGHIFVATRETTPPPGFFIYDFDVTSGLATRTVSVSGLDDLAPLIGPGSPGPGPSVPLPATVWSGALLGALMIGMRVRRSQRAGI